MLGERRAAILGLIIEEYIKTGEPIGSKALCELLPYSVSSATIRNEMAYLSQIGLIEQTHTSSGRVPCDLSYRFYVDNLMPSAQISQMEIQKIDEVLSINAGDAERLLADSARVLADVTHCMTFSSAIEDDFDCIQGVELIPAGGNCAMLVMLTVAGKIKSSICRVNCPIDNEFKKEFYTAVNEYFIGTPLSEVSLATIQSASISLGNLMFDMLPVFTTLCSLCNEASKGTLNFEGETNLLSHDELGNDVYKLLSFITRKDKVKQLLTKFSNSRKDAVLFIGNENPCYDLKNTSTLVARFNYSNEQKAVIGFIGSTRIDYSYILPRANYIMRATSKLLKEGGLTYE